MTKMVSKVPEDYKGLFVHKNDSYFDLHVKSKWESLPEEKHEILRDVDFSEVLVGNILKTQFGEARLLDMSTGSKTCLNILAVREFACYVDLLECGDNAVEKAIKISDGYPVTLVVHEYYGDLPCAVTFNGKLVEGNLNIYDGVNHDA
jgi:hypothetical protein